MEYVIKLRDKRVYDAVVLFLRSLGLHTSEGYVQDAKTSKGASESKGLLTEEDAKDLDAQSLGLAAFDAGFDADEEDISSWVVKEPNPTYGR
jgi:hypothetical protein